jgi:hypothetical protein
MEKIKPKAMKPIPNLDTGRNVDWLLIRSGAAQDLD